MGRYYMSSIGSLYSMAWEKKESGSETSDIIDIYSMIGLI
ncbi:55210cca-c9b7-479d-8411-c695ce4438b5 [Sclerotinia trifoliorum]|uniref:55210cca-c9b7-479d-8411-c695ce4438b5 n=1 Tax=Sclerotinia trifoliorum TaxID=28548 RepID=A0A8H2ZS37_9HELO|nr:55210cca-c9b7-479d-8411-c695ce4438b5 [Sclerotinia trifoliorum]